MCAYNAVNGVPSCANHYLLTELARDKWGFDGYITGTYTRVQQTMFIMVFFFLPTNILYFLGDCGAVDDVQNGHHYTSTSGKV